MRRGITGLCCLIFLACGTEGGIPGTARRTAAEIQGGSVDTLLARGRERYASGDYAGARSAWIQSLTVAHSGGDDRGEAALHTWIGLASWRLGELDSARASEERAIALKRRLPPPNDLWRSLNALGLVVLDQALNDSAAALFESALASAESESDREGIAKATGNAALAYTYLGDLQRARIGHRAMRSAGARVGDLRIEANGLANEAMVDVWEGDATAAIARLDTTLVMYRRIHDDVGEQNALGQRATAHEFVGSVSNAFRDLDSALAIAQNRRLRQQTIESLRLLGGLHGRMGDYSRALRYFEDAEKMARASAIDSDLGSILRGAASANLAVHNIVKAGMQGREALMLHRASGEPLEEIDDLVLLDRIAEISGDRASSKALLDSAEMVARSSAPESIEMLRLAVAASADHEGDAEKVLKALRGLDGDDPRFDPEMRAAFFQLKTRAYLHLGSVARAVENGAKAVSAVEKVRSSIDAAPVRSTFVADRRSVYGDYISALSRAGRMEDAFVVSDRGRSRALLDRLAATSLRRGGRAPVELIESERLLRRIDALTATLRSDGVQRADPDRGLPPPQSDDLLRKLRETETEYERLVIRSRQRTPQRAVLLGSANPVRLADVQRALRKKEALVEYFLVRDSIEIFVVTRTSLRMITRPLDLRTLGYRVRLLEDLWGRKATNWRLGLDIAAALYSDLITPALESGGVAQENALVIVPHGILAQVPFAALTDPVSRKFLVQRFSILFDPSARAFVELRKDGRGNRAHTEAVGFAPFTRTLQSTPGDMAALQRSMPFARTLIDREATEEALRSALGSGGIVHVATHGALNYRNPLFSRIEMARGSRTPASTNDGRLEVRELLGIDVTSPFVFLAGCETGALDQWLDGETYSAGDLSISQSLLSAGAKNVVSTLWPIDDSGAAAFTQVFYKSLARSEAAESLSHAQRVIAADARYASPYYWGGFVLNGSGNFSMRPQKQNDFAVK